MDAETKGPAWKSLYKISGACALIVAGLYMTEFVLFGAFGAGPAPNTANDWFVLLQHNSLLGLFMLNLLDLPAFALMIPVFLALYGALRRANEAYSAFALVFVYIAIAVYYASNVAFAMLFLSDQYVAATTDTQRSLLLAAGQALLAVGQGTGAWMWSILFSAGGVIISVIMLRSMIFGNVTAYVGIAANVLGLGPYIIAYVLAPAASILIILVAGVLLLVWFVLIGRTLLQLGRGASKEKISVAESHSG